jgi:exodeoxyribonuclease-3
VNWPSTAPVVLGDFNIAPEDRDVHDPPDRPGSGQSEEREALRALMSLGLIDVFRKFEQPARSYSWWDYRAAEKQRPAHRPGARFRGADRALQRLTIDREPRRRAGFRPHAGHCHV